VKGVAGSERGLVLEIRGRQAVVVTPEGQFRRVALDGPVPEVGEEIILPPRASRGIPWYRVAVAAAALLFILAFIVPGTAGLFGGTGEVAYYISVDINPSVELAADRRERVVEARALNPEGEALLEGLRLERVRIQEAVAELAREAGRKGYFPAPGEGLLLLAVVPAADAGGGLEAGANLAARLKAAAEQALEENGVVPVVEAAAMQPSLREHASRAGLSSGKYAVLLESLAQGVPVRGESLKEEGIPEVLRKAGADWREILRSLGGGKDLEEKEKRIKPMLEQALGAADGEPLAAGRAGDGREEVGDGRRGHPVKALPGSPARTGGGEGEEKRLRDGPEYGQEEGIGEAGKGQPGGTGQTGGNKGREAPANGRTGDPEEGEAAGGRESPASGERYAPGPTGIEFSRRDAQGRPAAGFIMD